METHETTLAPTVGNALGQGWTVTFRYFLYALLAIVFLGVAAMPFGGVTMLAFPAIHMKEFIFFQPLFNIFSIAYSIFVYTPISYGVVMLFISMSRREEVDLNVLFDGFRKQYLNVILASILTGLIVGVGMVFLIIPGIIFACRLAFVPHLVMDKKLDAVQAVETSWKMTRGHGWKVFFIGFLSIFIALAGLALIFFGVIIAAMWITATFAVLYILVDKHYQASLNAA